MQRKQFLRACAASAASAASAVSTVAALGFAHIARAQTVRLRVAHTSPESSSQHAAALRFAGQVKEGSDGALDIRVYPNSQLGNDITALGGVRGGTMDIIFGGAGSFAGLVPQWDGLELPFLFSGPEHVARVYDGDIGQDLFASLPAAGLQGLAWWENGFRCITTRKRAVQAPEDVKGLKIRVQPTPIHVLTWRLLGANPVPMAIGELYQALESGAVDAQEHPITIAHSAKYYEVQKHLTMSRHVYTSLPVFMNKAKFDSLSPAHQTLLRETAQEAGRWQRQKNREDEALLIADFRKHGMEVLETYDAEPFRAIVEAETRKDFVAKMGDNLLKAIQAARA